MNALLTQDNIYSQQILAPYQIIACTYFHNRRRHFMKLILVSLTTHQLVVLRHLETRLCSHAESSTSIQHQFLGLTELGPSVDQPFKVLSP